MITNFHTYTIIFGCHLRQLMRDETLYKKIGLKIQEIRLQKNLSQQDLAAKCNFEKSNMSRVEAGRVNSTVSTLNKIAKGLDVNIIELFKF
ncbi:XRE family transcriptional regulator [Gramella sp. KN1008]|nr:helix-turn-helix transcriptional regulator [Gramella sp. KN1008]TBW26971.1 XRE family transcriptional regulator [Gramella sp. KN1008]